MSQGSKAQRFARITCAATSSGSALIEALEAGRYTVLRLDGSGVRDKASFLRQLELDLPGPDDISTGNWDAAADWLWQLFSKVDDDQIAIVWSDAHVLLESSLETLLTGVTMITEVAAMKFSRPKHIIVCLVGDGETFPELSF